MGVTWGQLSSSSGSMFRVARLARGNKPRNLRRAKDYTKSSGRTSTPGLPRGIAQKEVGGISLVLRASKAVQYDMHVALVGPGHLG